jgi:putative toxin-antitoxin system antitoxin component (TIGR02293 family)
MNPASVYEVLGGERALGVPPAGIPEMRQLLEQGLPYPALESVQNTLDLSPSEVLRSLGITTRTLRRRKEASKLGPAESDRLFRLARVAALALDVFEDTEKVRRWLHKPNRALGGDIPILLLSTDIGARQVEEALIAIDHGIFA